MVRTTVDTGMVEHYRAITRRALDSVEIKGEEGSREYNIAKDFLDMASRYFSDAQYFQEKGDLINALCAIYYAHAWLDAGVRAGILKATTNGDLFTLP